MAPWILAQDQCLLVNSNNALLCQYGWQNFYIYEALPFMLQQLVFGAKCIRFVLKKAKQGRLQQRQPI